MPKEWLKEDRQCARCPEPIKAGTFAVLGRDGDWIHPGCVKRDPEAAKWKKAARKKRESEGRRQRQEAQAAWLADADWTPDTAGDWDKFFR